MQTKQAINASIANKTSSMEALVARGRQHLMAYEDPVTVAHMSADRVLIEFGKYRAAEGIAYARTGASAAEFDA